MSIDRGRFTWFAHKSATPASAERFYTEVLPWTVEHTPMGGGDSYPVVKAQGVAIGGITTLPPGVDAPAHWISYVSVDDVDATAKKVVAAGGRTLMDAFDVPTVGRMQPVADPHGAALVLFKGEQGDAPPASGAGSFHWNELWSPDVDASLAFYEKAFGYTHSAMPMPDGTYYMLENHGKPRGGIMASPSRDIPAHWLPYVAVTDLSDALARVKRHGGKVELDPMEMPGVGRFTFVRDQLGARLGLITPAPRG